MRTFGPYRSPPLETGADVARALASTAGYFIRWSGFSTNHGALPMPGCYASGNYVDEYDGTGTAEGYHYRPGNDDIHLAIPASIVEFMSGHPYQCTASYGASRPDERLRIKANLTARSVLVHLPGESASSYLERWQAWRSYFLDEYFLKGHNLPAPATFSYLNPSFFNTSMNKNPRPNTSTWHSIDAHADAIRAIHTQLGEFLSQPT
jgi:hypothetical protein